jgi:mono/diheme cytochrome c family protein
MRYPTGTIRAVLAVGALACVAATTGVQAEPQPPKILIDSVAGRDSFDLYCSPCHGKTGRGDGPVAPALKSQPADLTRLTQLSGGTFPADGVRAFVIGVGRPIAAHGTGDMPVWGPLFRFFESDVRVRERVANIVTYIESLQQKPGASRAAGSSDQGAPLFKTYCAACHGANGRGAGPASEQFRKIPPDLTKYTINNGGVFPSERVRRIIDGTGVAAHGDRDMPVWGDAFQGGREGLTAEAAKARIDLIVRFLEGIQARAAH